MTLKNKFAEPICHKRQCHLIQYSLDTVPVAGLYKNKEQTSDPETNAASPATSNSLTLYSLRTPNNAWKGCQKLWLQFARGASLGFLLSESVSGVQGAFFANPESGGGGQRAVGFLFQGDGCVYMARSRAMHPSPAPEAEAGWHVSTALH